MNEARSAQCGIYPAVSANVTCVGDDIWVVHAFQKKSKTGIATPKHELDVVRERIKRLKEALA